MNGATPETHSARVPAEPNAHQTTEPAGIVAPEGCDGKTLSTLRASLALSGHAVHSLADGRFLVVATRWAGLCREVPDLHALAAFARQIGACR